MLGVLLSDFFLNGILATIFGKSQENKTISQKQTCDF